ncbi:unnamed protein product [Lota lota]
MWVGRVGGWVTVMFGYVWCYWWSGGGSFLWKSVVNLICVSGSLRPPYINTVHSGPTPNTNACTHTHTPHKKTQDDKSVLASFGKRLCHKNHGFLHNTKQHFMFNWQYVK